MPFLEVTGLKETLDGLGRLERMDVARDLRDVFSHVAAEAVGEARGRAHTRMQRRAAQTLSNASTATYGAVRFGGGFPGAFGSEFGAGRNTRRVVNHFGYYTGWNQFDYWKGSGAGAGYFVWPALRDVTRDSRPMVADEVARIFEKAGA